MTLHRIAVALLLVTIILFAIAAVSAGTVPERIAVKLSPYASPTINQRIAQLPQVRSISNLTGNISALDQSDVLSRWRIIHVNPGTEADVVNALSSDASCEVVVPLRRYTVDEIVAPDSLTGQQWGLGAIQINGAWRVTTGNPSVIIGVIDTGCDWHHPDLAPVLWNNPREDSTRTGRNGSDDDGNGFVDDFHGWNFVENNNRVDDVMGHGTMVNGVIAAAANRIGILGAAPNVRLMTLRAGDANGYLDEDNVAAALVYAASNGARVVNMSFGDQVVAPLLRDAVQYAFASGLTLVASSGNSGENTTHFPSGYEEVISVGAIGSTITRASFSSYGSTLDLMAPGVDILSDAMDNRYETANGTSFSSPFVAGVAGLLLSRDSTLSPTSIRTILCCSATDIGSPGWDIETGHGVLNAELALQMMPQAEARILSPTEGSTITTDSLVVNGTVAGQRLLSWTLAYGVSDNPSQWTELQYNATEQRVRENLAVIRFTNPNDSIYTIRLVANVSDGNPFETRVVVRRDASAPRILRTSIVPALVGGSWGWRVEARTDDPTRMELRWWNHGTVYNRPFSYIDTEHALAFNPDPIVSENDSCRLIATNTSGLSVSSNTFRFPTLPTLPPSLPFVEHREWQLPSGHILPKQLDWNNDGNPELLLNQYNSSGSYDTLRLLELQGTQFVPRVNYGVTIAQTVVDVTGDGTPELMIRAAGATWILKSTSSIQFPFSEIVRDTLSSYGAWMGDFVSGDPISNFILRRNKRYEVWGLNWNAGGMYTPELIDSLTNPSRGSNGLGRPRVRIGNIQGGSSIVALWGDTDGDFLLHLRNANGRWQRVWSDSLGNGDATDFCDVGDYDGDGVDEFVVGYETASSVHSEHEAPQRKWVYYLYKWIGSRAVRQDTLIIDGAIDPRESDSGIESGDVDGDGRKEIFISAAPHLIIMKVDPSTHRWQIVYLANDCQSNAVAMLDLNHNGRKEIAYNTGNGFRFFEFAGNGSSQLFAPSGITAFPLDTARISVAWNAVPNAISYRLARLIEGMAVDTIIVATTSFIDTTVSPGSGVYSYAVAGYNASLPIPLGAFSVAASAHPNTPPQLMSVSYVSNGFVRIEFSEPLSSESLTPNRFSVTPGVFPISVLASRNGAELLLRFDPPLASGSHTLTVLNVTDRERTPLTASNRLNFDVPVLTSRTFFLADAVLRDGCFIATFSLPYDPATLSVDRFAVLPWITLVAVVPIDSMTVRLVPSATTPVGNYGVVYQVKALSGLRSLSGLSLDTEYATRAISTQPATLDQLVVYPNPARLGRGEVVRIAGLPEGTEVTITTVSGLIVRKLSADRISGGTVWDGRTENGGEVAAGVYYLVAVHDGNKLMGKLAVVR